VCQPGGSFPIPPFAAVYGTFPFTAGGDNFGLVRAGPVGALNSAGYFLTSVLMIEDGNLTPFNLYISAVGGPPPADSDGVAYGVSFLTNPGGVYTEGFAVRIDP
jgi:hypothetical protein